MAGIRSSRQRAGLRRLIDAIGLLVVLIILWQLVTTLAPSPFFPTPLRIGENALRMFFGGKPETLFLTPNLTRDTAGTLGRMILGYALGSAAGIVIGSAIGRSRATREITTPIVEFFRSVPATASLPLFIILLGGEDNMRVAFIAWGCSWFVLVNTASGVAGLHPTLLNVGVAYRLGPVRRFLGIILPAAMPKIFAGLRIALTSALLLAVVSEFFLASQGVGFQLIQAQRTYRIVDMWGWMLLLAVLGLLLNTLLEVAEHRVLAWHRLSRATA